jgi:hypothetical protein
MYEKIETYINIVFDTNSRSNSISTSNNGVIEHRSSGQ